MRYQQNREIDEVTWVDQAATFRSRSNKKAYRAFKRGFDIVFSLFLLVLMSPLIIFIAILVKLESPGSVFYKQERLGIDGKKFYILKIRSMRNDAEKHGPQWASKNDPRVTNVGLFIRKTRIDELPQLFNVLKGEMAIIGPRPEREIFINEFSKKIPRFSERLMVKPGLTGWAQVNGGYDISIKEKFELDMFYIENESIGLDIKIFFKTIKVVFTGNGAR
ncbi:UDP-phosphate N-acetylgalactosaminyl-1-phosphate transferase [Bacillus pseudomycoides]|nr:UDP-phosphate N-acetylgalactosaminyl-1-phosphate transferase [Bacillus pseudomycoides]